ncbi:MAG: helix-turn-helix domain-containing protein, partial [Umezawaea sp.]
MDTVDELADLAALLADRTRAAFCVALLDGRAWTAGELAAHAGVAASTASEHLGRLVAGGLLAERRQGRHRYVQLADQRAAQLVEDLLA